MQLNIFIEMKNYTKKFTLSNNSTSEIYTKGTVDYSNSETIFSFPVYPDIISPSFTITKEIDIKNIGSSEIKNPLIFTDKKIDYYNLKEFVDDITKDQKRDINKILSIFDFIFSNVHFAQDPEIIHDKENFIFDKKSKPWKPYISYEYTRSNETLDVLRNINSYGMGNCLSVVMIFNSMCEVLNLKTRIVHIKDHYVSEIFVDNKWRFVDPLLGVYIFDNNNLIEVKDIIKNKNLTDDIHFKYVRKNDYLGNDDTYILNKSKWDNYRELFSEYEICNYPKYTQEKYLSLILKPNDKLKYRFYNTGKYHTFVTPNRYNHNRPQHRISTSTFYRNFNIKHNDEDYIINLPYPIVGCKILFNYTDNIKEFIIKAENKTISIIPISEECIIDRNLDVLNNPAIHKLDFSSLKNVNFKIEIDFQVLIDTLPDLKIGGNIINYQSSTSNDKIEIKYHYTKRDEQIPNTPKIEDIFIYDGLLHIKLIKNKSITIYNIRVIEKNGIINPQFNRYIRNSEINLKNILTQTFSNIITIEIRSMSIEEVWSDSCLIKINKKTGQII